MKIVGIYLAASCLLWLSGCVQPQQVDLIEREQRRLRSENTAVQSEIGPLRSDIDAMRASLADTRATQQQQQRELSALKERVEETRFQMGRQLGQSSREGDQRIKDLEGRVAKLGDALKTQEATLKARDDDLKQLRDTVQTTQKALAEVPPSDAAPEVMVVESEPVRRDYEAAWRALEKKDYKLAVGRFKEFLKKHAKSKLAANAQYWLGECHYALREFDQAIIEFDAVRRKYPQGDKVPAALLKQGYSFAELGEKVNARLILQEVVEKYPQSSEAAKAKLKLKALES